ncbi:MAG: RodZ domain-containing protein [Pseudomonadota bacterium]
MNKQIADPVMAELALPTASAEASIEPSIKEGSLQSLAAESSFTALTASIGGQLRTARETRGMSIGQAAQALKLSPRQIVALESDDWKNLPGNTMIRGFVRNYARLLKLDSEALMVALNVAHIPSSGQLNIPVDNHHTPLPQKHQLERSDSARVLAGVSLITLSLLVYFFAPQNLWQMALDRLGINPPQAVPTSVITEPAPLSANTLPTSNTTVETLVDSGTALSPENMQLSSESSMPASGIPASTDNSLKFSFAQTAWVEVRDRDGQIIFSQTNPAFSQRSIEGRAPFHLTISNATHVTVQYQGKIIDLPPRAKDDVARLTLE